MFKAGEQGKGVRWGRAKGRNKGEGLGWEKGLCLRVGKR